MKSISLVIILFTLIGCGKVGPLSLPEDQVDKSVITLLRIWYVPIVSDEIAASSPEFTLKFVTLSCTGVNSDVELLYMIYYYFVLLLLFY